MDKNTYISNKIRKILNENLNIPKERAVAIAYSYYEREKDKKQEGGETYLPEYQMWSFTLPQQVNVQNQFMSPQQDFSVQNQDYLRTVFTPAQVQPMTMSPGNYNAWDIDNNGVPDSIQKLEGNPIVQQTTEQKQSDETLKKYNDFVKYNILNPYGGVSPISGFQYGLYNLGASNNDKALAGLSRAGLGFLREGLSAFGAGKNDRQVWENYQDQQYNQPPIYERQQEGGYTKQYKQGVEYSLDENEIQDLISKGYKIRYVE